MDMAKIETPHYDFFNDKKTFYKRFVNEIKARKLSYGFNPALTRADLKLAYPARRRALKLDTVVQ
jgi:hypothetical protein